MRPYFIDLTIPVVGGVGSAPFGILASVNNYPGNIYGILRNVCIQKPAGMGPDPTYDYFVFDTKPVCIAGRSGKTGDATQAEDVPVVYGGTFELINVGVDGDYPVRLYLQRKAPY